MTRRPILAALAAGALALAGVAAGTAPASAASSTSASTSFSSCTIGMPSGPVHIAAYWVQHGLTKTGTVQILAGGRGPVRIITDRVAWQRGAAGFATPGRVRAWSVHYPVGFYTSAHVAVQDTSGVIRSCGTR